ncbi:protein-serine O-palmitoleoyltransferase porcupine-like [Amphiura filiformis]|uniref:protein-serine O-palmitoleoyltransferase porcupine-like n=1 Tax=Amphiura filiformis TaxID=82378 RepID=UPI003B213C33
MEYDEYEDYDEYDQDNMMQQYGDEYYDYGDGMQQDQDFTYWGHFENCVVPSISQGVQITLPLLLLCMAMKVTTLFSLPSSVFHFLSIGSGLVAMAFFFEKYLFYIISLTVLGYFALQVANQTLGKYRGAVCAVVVVTYLVIMELFLADPSQWHRVRGCQMIVAMKIISVGFDVDQGTLKEIPDVIEFTGYCVFAGSIIFGPWISYSTYALAAQGVDLDLRYTATVVVKLLQALACLVISTCIAPIMFTSESWHYKWLHAYRDAMSFRFSHYFISYLSETTGILAGLGATGNVEEGDKVKWSFAVAKPLNVELPRSLVEVVTNWNLPMHSWLKNYVFKTSRHLGNFAAILLTYAASSLLHGINFQLAAVLLSLGLYSYTEYVLRQKLSDAFSACVGAKACKPACSHRNKKKNVLVILTNVVFGLLAMFHLAYLGLMFDTDDSELEEQGYDWTHTLSKWSHLNYASHWVALITFVFYWLIK